MSANNHECEFKHHKSYAQKCFGGSIDITNIQICAHCGKMREEPNGPMPWPVKVALIGLVLVLLGGPLMVIFTLNK